MLLVVLFVEEPAKPPSATKPTNAEDTFIPYWGVAVLVWVTAISAWLVGAWCASPTPPSPFLPRQEMNLHPLPALGALHPLPSPWDPLASELRPPEGTRRDSARGG